MEGQKEYEKKIITKIEGLIKKNNGKQYLNGFYYYLSSDHSYSSIYNYLLHVISFMDFSGNKSLEQLRLDDYTMFLSKIKNCTQSYQIAVYSALKNFSTYLVANGNNINNPMQYVKRPRFFEDTTTKEKREKGFLTGSEIKKYIRTVQEGTGSSRACARQERWKDRDMLIVYILLSTGMRCSALYKLNISDIDFSKKKLITIDKGGIINEYPLEDMIIDCALKWMDTRNEILDGTKEDALFISNQKTRMDQSSISRIVNKYASSIKGKHITPHKLRATYASTIYNETKDLYLTQKCMGHSTPKMTEIYIRGQKDVNRERGLEIMSKNLKFQ